MLTEPSGVLSSFDAFARAEMPRLLGLARLLCGNDHDAWDLTQDTLIQVSRHWQRIDADRNPGAYARRCVVNLNHNRLRRLSREVLTASVPDRSDKGSELGQENLDEWLDVALQRLPWKQRAAVTLAYLEDLSVRDIAFVLDCSMSAAKTHLSRGRDSLRQAAAAESAERTPRPAPQLRSADHGN